MMSPTNFAKSTLFSAVKCWRQFRTPADAYEIRWVAPEEVDYVTVCDARCTCIEDGRYTSENVPNSGVFSVNMAGKFIGGDWDLKLIGFDDYVPYQSFQQHFVAGVPWEETIFYKNVVDSIREGQVLWGIRNEEEFKNTRCRYIDELFEDIRDNGYQSQPNRADYPNDPKMYDEVQLNIGRDGHYLLNDGKHRLCIAKILEVEKIPVRIVVHHKRHAD